MSSGLTKAAVERNQRTILELLKQPGNDVCADCRARNPRWASWNLGIFICVNCAGIHRKMGTHISKVKSLTLDTWTKEQVERMKTTGNSRANKQWNPNEAKNPPPTDLEESERDSQLEKFIRKKYESRVFATETAPAPIKPVPQKAPLAVSTTLGSSPSLHGSNGSLPALPSSAVGLHSQQIRSASLQTSGIQRAKLNSTRASESFYAQSPSSIQSSFAPVPPVRPSTAPIPHAANPEPAPPLPPLPPSILFPAALSSAPSRIGMFNMSSHPSTYSLRQTSNPVISPTPTMRTDGVWGDLLQLSNPVVSGSINQSGLNSNGQHAMQTSVNSSWNNPSMPTSTSQQTLHNPSSQTPGYMNLMTSNSVNLGAPNQSRFHNQITPHQQEFSNQSRSVSTPTNLASTNPFNVSNFLPPSTTNHSTLQTNPFFNPSGHMALVNNPFPSNNPFAAQAAASFNSFQPGGQSFSGNSVLPFSAQQQQQQQQILQQQQYHHHHQQQQQQQQQSTQPGFSFHNPYAS